ncbi:MAG: MarR family winged helix-turn-helix transcriptional regulator [Ilumatobacteraceae bacterium]
MAVCFNLIRSADQLTNDLEGLHRPVGWTWPGFRVVFWIWLLGPIEQREIATRIGASRASISSVVNTLERDGFVLRKRTADDRRLVTVELTSVGSDVIEAAFTAQNHREAEWMAVFDENEREILVQLLGRLLSRRLSRP